MRFGRRGRPATDAGSEVQVLREFLAELRRTFDSVASGHSDARMPSVPGAESFPDAVAVRATFHSAVSDSDARLQATLAELDEARRTLAAYEQHALEAAAMRESLADQLEATVGAIAEQVLRPPRSSPRRLRRCRCRPRTRCRRPVRPARPWRGSTTRPARSRTC